MGKILAYRSREDSHVIKEEMLRLNSIEKKAQKEIDDIKYSDIALEHIGRYRKAFDELYLEYEEKCPEEGGKEDSIFAMQLDKFLRGSVGKYNFKCLNTNKDTLFFRGSGRGRKPEWAEITMKKFIEEVAIEIANKTITDFKAD